MKNINSFSKAILISLLISSAAVCCTNNSFSSKNIADSTKYMVIDSNKAIELYAEGMTILNERISIQDSNEIKAIALNKKAVEMFSAAHKADSNFIKPVMFASECTMFARDYQNCIYWTAIWQRLDTTQQNQAFCIDRIALCNRNLKLKQ